MEEVVHDVTGQDLLVGEDLDQDLLSEEGDRRQITNKDNLLIPRPHLCK